MGPWSRHILTPPTRYPPLSILAASTKALSHCRQLLLLLDLGRARRCCGKDAGDSSDGARVQHLYSSCSRWRPGYQKLHTEMSCECPVPGEKWTACSVPGIFLCHQLQAELQCDPVQIFPWQYMYLTRRCFSYVRGSLLPTCNRTVCTVSRESLALPLYGTCENGSGTFRGTLQVGLTDLELNLYLPCLLFFILFFLIPLVWEW